KITVRFQTLVKDLNVTWTVHWFDCVFTVFRRSCEHRVCVFIPVTRTFPKNAVHH
ncbi:hypothetical protein D018_1386B, partial [Vibrio parahaemolyticus VP2007-007]